MAQVRLLTQNRFMTHLLQQQSLLVLFCQLIGRKGALDACPDHYAIKISAGRHV